MVGFVETQQPHAEERGIGEIERRASLASGPVGGFLLVTDRLDRKRHMQ